MTFVDFVRLLRANAARLVLAALLGGTAAYAYARTLPPVFVADASGYIVSAGSQGDLGQVMANSAVTSSKGSAYVQLAQTRKVAQRAIEDIGISASPSDVVGRVSVSIADGSSILRITAVGPDPEEARLLADAFARAIAAVANELELGGSAKPGEKALVRIVPVDSALPAAQIGPNVRKYVLAGIGAGAGAMLGWILLRRLLDTRVRTVKDVEDSEGGTVLSIVPITPELRAGKGRGQLARLGWAAESFRQLRTNLRFVNVDKPPRSIVITSANPGEGKSTMSSTLARVLGEGGQPTVLIDADLRRPMLATIFDRHGSIGLTQVLSGQISVEDALQDTDQANVKLITAGRIPPNPSELLGSHRMQQLIEELSRTHMVILDAPPLLPVTDAGLLTAMCDGALMVFAVGKTHREQVRQCTKVMGHVGGRVLGVILNLAPRKAIAGVVYGYGYGYGSYKSHQDYYSSATGKGRRGRKRSRREAAESETEATPPTALSPEPVGSTPEA